MNRAETADMMAMVTMRNPSRRAFSLLEMLTVLAILALLVSLLLPTISLMKRHAGIAPCLSNQRQLCLAWTLYHGDHDNRLVGGSNYADNQDPVPQPTPWRWVEKPLYDAADNAETDPLPPEADLCLEYRLNGIRAGRLFAYLGSESVYHCPQDPTATKLAEPYAAYRSYAITGLMNGEDFVARAGGMYTPITEHTFAYFDGKRRTLECVTRFDRIESPGGKAVFVEEKLDGRQVYNMGSFVLMADATPSSWWDYPADFHPGRSTLGFADGHVEPHRWTDERTRDLMANGWDTAPLSQPNNNDLAWLIDRYIPRP